MIRYLFALIATLLYMLSSKTSYANSNCPETADPIGICVAANGDSFKFTENPDCGLDEYKRHNETDPSQAISSGLNEESLQVTYILEKNIVTLPAYVSMRIDEIYMTAHFEARTLALTIKDEKKKDAAVKKIFAHARAKSVYGGEVFSLDANSHPRSGGSLRCRIYTDPAS